MKSLDDLTTEVADTRARMEAAREESRVASDNARHAYDRLRERMVRDGLEEATLPNGQVARLTRVFGTLVLEFSDPPDDHSGSRPAFGGKISAYGNRGE